MNLFRRFAFRRRAEELQEELESHLRMAAADRVVRGESEPSARQAALREFGNVPLVQDITHDSWEWPWLERLLQDFRYTLRQMTRSPGFAATVIGILGLGIAAAAAMFTVVDHELLQPMPYRDPGRLVTIREGSGKDANWGAPWMDIQQWMERSRSFRQIAFSTEMGKQEYLEQTAAAVHVSGQEVTSNLFGMLGVHPILGRAFLPEKPGSATGRNAGTLVLSYAVWQAAFDGSRSVVGRVISVNTTPYTIIGVMPPGFRYPLNPVATREGQVWTALRLGPDDWKNAPYGPQYQVIARLQDSATLRSARSEMAAIQKRVAEGYTDPYARKTLDALTLQRYASFLVNDDLRRALLSLLLSAAVLWLIASLNVMNLLLARGTARQREIAMRGALGASRGRLLQQMIVEGLILSVSAAILGASVAFAAVRLLGHELHQQLPLPAPAAPNLLILLVLLGLTVLSTMLAALWPALFAVRTPIEAALRQDGAQTGSSRRHHRLREVLVTTEIAMSLPLLVACGLLLQTIYALRRVPLGYRTDHIIVANLNVPSFRFAGKDLPQTLYMPLLERVQHLHGVLDAGLINEVPLGHTFNITLGLRLNGKIIHAMLTPVTPGIQRVFRFRMLAGRFFNEQDSPTSQAVVVVNPAFVREYAPDKHNPASVIGTAMWQLHQGQPLHIIGVLDNERQESIADSSQPEVDLCLCQIVPGTMAYPVVTSFMDLAIRTSRPPAQMIPELRDIFGQASAEMRDASITTMGQIVEDSYGSQRLAAHLLEIFGGAALLLCVAGLYGLLGYVVAERTHEVGVRIALGARRGHVLWLVMRDAGAMLLAGTVSGAGMAVASVRLVRGFLYGVSAQNEWTLVCAAVLLIVSGLGAAYLPARTAANINPMEALRIE